MAMANFIPKTSSMILAPQPTKSSSSRSKKYLYGPPTRFPNCLARHVASMHAVEPISALVKENSGFAGITNRDDFFGSSSILCWDDFKQKENKLKCHWRKEDSVADAQEDTQSNKTKIRRSRRRSPKPFAIIIGASFCVVVGLCSLKLPKIPTRDYTDVPYSELIGGIQNGSVTNVRFVENSRRILFNTTSLGDQNAPIRPLRGSNIVSFPRWQYHTRIVEDDKYELLRLLKEKGVMYGSKPAIISASMKNFLFVFFQVAPFWIMVLLTFYQLSVQHDLGKITKRKPSKKQSVTFDDVEGVDAAKAELLEIVLCMKGDNKYVKLGAKIPKGVLLTGPPGTGKTLLARAVAGEAGVSFFSISASELVEVFVGRGAARVRDLFREARKNGPSIIFIDEIDAVGGQRGRTLNCERDQTLNQLLTDMDGFEKEASVVVIAATNRPETLDSALMRPGRFSRKVHVDKPDEIGRKKIFALYLRDVPMKDDKEAICDLVASLTPGLVGADLENIAHESVLLAARKGGEFVRKDDILEAVDRAKSKVYDDTAEARPFPFGPIMQERAQGGTMGFGFSN